LAHENIATYSMPLKVYLSSAIVRGVLVTNQERLSNHLFLREGETVFRFAKGNSPIFMASPSLDGATQGLGA
jgi:hypothetical protein